MSFNGPGEDMEMGILENSGPPNHRPQTEIEADNSSTDGSDHDDESIDGAGFVVRKKQEFHVRVERATPSPNAIQGNNTESSRHGVEQPQPGEGMRTQWKSY